MRYFTRPRAAPEGRWDDPLLPSISDSDHHPVDTGLLDSRGQTLWRAPETIGFHRPERPR